MSIERIIYGIENWKASRRSNLLVNRRIRYTKLADSWCNVMEYKGRLYIAINGIPYVALDISKGDAYIAEELGKIRSVWVDYMMAKER